MCGIGVLFTHTELYKSHGDLFLVEHAYGFQVELGGFMTIQ